MKAKTFLSSDNLPLKILIIAVFAGLIIFPQTAFMGAVTGIKLWGATIFPALFPTLIITSCIIKLFPMKSGVSYIYIIFSGLLCGYPLGAYLCDAYHCKHPEEHITNYIAAFCNISSPSFVINYIISQILYEKTEPWKVLLCIYSPVIECLIILVVIFRKEIFSNQQNHTEAVPGRTVKISEIIDTSVTDAINSMLKLAGYIIIFSCLSQYIVMLPFNNPLFKTLLCSITEITNGIYMCGQLNIDIKYIIILITGVNAFGGISTLMQTAGITSNTYFNLKTYLCGKTALTLLTIINAVFIL